jgi:UDP-N-acetylmuramoyl-tripeptide--D-alanyl-D-alanine ligase
MEAAGRKIFIFADMLELGKHSCRYHRKVADSVLEQDIDVVYTYGEQAGITASRCSALGHKRVYHFDDIKTLGVMLAGDILKGDVVLVKGSRAMRLERAIESFV